MEIAPTYEWMRVAMALTGTLSVYLGYRLFCDISHQQGRTGWSVLLTNLVSGALLAIFGLGILIADIRGVHGASPGAQKAWQKKRSTKEGSFDNPRANERSNVRERLI